MAQSTSYAREMQRERTLLLRHTLTELPSFLGEFFRGIEPNTSILTRLNYAYDIRTFLTFLTTERAAFHGRPVKSITLDDLDAITDTDIEVYTEYLSLYEKDDKLMENGEAGKERKLCSLRTLYNYFYKKNSLSHNTPSRVDLPKRHAKPIIYLEPDEVARILDEAENGENLTEHQKSYHKRTRVRDVALLTLFLSTGIRISECVGLNCDDVDTANATIRVTRKGGNQTILYLSDECIRALDPYIEQRKKQKTIAGHENALFLSLQNRRLDTRSVQNLVKNYARTAAPLKHISPHKLRSTFGTTLYRETGDIYLVAEVLGHSDVNTTRKHYAAMSEELRKAAAKAIKLRDD